MKKLFFSAALIGGALCISNKAEAQIQDEQNVTITMDLQPILQLNMNTADQVDFIFDDVASYAGGITKYGATILTISSSVNWDLYAVGFSTNGTRFWDVNVEYGAGVGGTNAVTDIPLSALEIRQYRANQFTGGLTAPDADYSAPFVQYASQLAATFASTNNIYVAANPYTPPSATERYIAGHSGTAVGQGVPGGSWLTNGQPGTASNYYYTIDYRIIPGLPAIFPGARTQGAAPTSEAIVAPNFAAPGVYTMNVKYVLLEDQ